MRVDYTEAQSELRREFRAYFSNLVKPEYREELRNAESGDLYKELIRQQGKDNMLAVGWPEEYGGRGLTESEQLIRYEEALLAGAPTPFVTLNTVGPAIMSRGTDELALKDLLDRRVRNALALREHLFAEPYYRLIFGEGEFRRRRPRRGRPTRSG